MPSSGVERCASVIGKASRTTRAWLTSTRRPGAPPSANIARIQKPQDQPDRDDNDRASENIIGNVADRVKAKRPDAIDEVPEPLKNIDRPDVEPHQESADDQGDEQEPHEDSGRRATEEARERRVGMLPSRRARRALAPMRRLGRAGIIDHKIILANRVEDIA